MENSAIYSEENRKRFLVVAAILIVVIAVVDWQTKAFISIGFLYLFPILLVAGFLPRWRRHSSLGHGSRVLDVLRSAPRDVGVFRKLDYRRTKIYSGPPLTAQGCA